MAMTEENTVDTSLNGRTALITGASKGLGLATAKAFYSHGAKVVLLARGAADLPPLKRNPSLGGGRRISRGR